MVRSWISNAILVAFLSVAIVALAAGVRTYLLARKAAVFMKDFRPYERIQPAASSVIIFAGDSTAVGTGSSDPAFSVAGRFGALFPDATIRNYGKNGMKLGDLAVTLADPAIGKADMLILQIGANDILRFTPLAAVKKNLELVLKEASAISPRVVILHGGNVGLAPFFPRPLGWIWSRRTRQVRDIYLKQAAAAGAIYVDLYRSRQDDPFLTDISKYYAPDLLHPSGEGYRIWFEEIQKTLSDHSKPER